MKTRRLSWAIAMVLGASTAGQATAQTLEERVRRLEQENREQAVAIDQQQRTIAQQKQQLEGSPQRVERLEETLETKRDAGTGLGGWFEHIEIGALIEVEGVYVDPYEGSSESDLVLATFELGIAAQVTDWVEAMASLLYEEDDTDLEVDLAMITIANPDVTPVFFTAGQFYLPFGAYETNLVSDPLTLEIGETRQTAAQLGFVYQGFSGSLYAFNGDNKVDGDDNINSWGANLAFAQEREDLVWTVGAGYINDLGDSDTLQDSVADNRAARQLEIAELRPAEAEQFSLDPTERTGGWTANLGLVYRNFNLIGEYLSATERFDPDSLSFKDKGAEPAAWNIELGYSFEVFGKESVAAVAYQGSSEAVNLELPETRWALGWSIGIFDGTALSFEYAHDKDYSTRDGGTGNNSNAFVAQLAVEF
ncbi:LbtU family siderophore porin [Lamprobacter modestohalophilus]|uniref:LbtU family siderophore porin n=1 Tax=Lamprobacter modestohalophilus TaxID=1064514 RepID=UPI002ADECCAF|nr:LbtU family siderophore porin [Lamprobacter modestohalophilus]MEA1050414.1 LbtU family siderophore porin [Lamprobacter modestohalophilus]